MERLIKSTGHHLPEPWPRILNFTVVDPWFPKGANLANFQRGSVSKKCVKTKESGASLDPPMPQLPHLLHAPSRLVSPRLREVAVLQEIFFTLCNLLKEVGFQQPGSLRLCTTPDRMDEARYQMARQGWNGAPQWIVTPDEIHEMHPLLNMDGVGFHATLKGKVFCEIS